MKELIGIGMIIIVIISLIGVQALQGMEIDSLREQIDSMPKFDAGEIYLIKIKQANIESKIDSINYNISEIKDQLHSSMEWFTTNSKIEDPKIINKLSQCADGCNINLNCIAEVNEALGFKYIIDTNETEYLKSIDEFIADGFGDCEDYWLLYKAEYNTLVDNMGACDEIISTDYETGINLYTDGNMYVICGQNDEDAHCLNYIVGIETGKKYFIEPQWGMYDPDFEEEYPTLTFIITDDNFEIYNFDTNTWYSYSELYDKVENVLK